MNLVYQIIERNQSDGTTTVRYTTDKVGATALNPQMESGAVKLRTDGLVARCDGDLCIQMAAIPSAKLDAVMKMYAPVDILHAAELQVDPTATTSVDSVTVLPEQSITVG